MFTCTTAYLSLYQYIQGKKPRNPQAHGSYLATYGSIDHNFLCVHVPLCILVSITVIKERTPQSYKPMYHLPHSLLLHPRKEIHKSTIHITKIKVYLPLCNSVFVLMFKEGKKPISLQSHVLCLCVCTLVTVTLCKN